VKPIIACSVGSIVELIDDETTGLLVPADADVRRGSTAAEPLPLTGS
jgi:hypothetical protein